MRFDCKTVDNFDSDWVTLISPAAQTAAEQFCSEIDYDGEVLVRRNDVIERFSVTTKQVKNYEAVSLGNFDDPGVL